MARLSGEQKKRLHEALRKDFSPQDLRELFVFYLEMPIDEIISPNDDSRAAALKVITASEREGSLTALLRAVADQRPGRPDIQALVAELLAVLESSPPASPAPQPTLPSTAPKAEPVVQAEPAPEADGSRITPHVSPPPTTALVSDALLIIEPVRMEFVRVDDGRPLRMGTPPSQVQDMLKRFDGAKYFEENGLFKQEQPASKVPVAPFAIGRYPVTNAQYAAFVEATGHRPPEHFNWDLPPSGKEQHPVVEVSWRDAVAFTEWLSRATGRSLRLPTEVEWEKAARGADGRLWPWGDEWDPKRATTRENGPYDTTPVGAYSPGGNSPCGAADMAGNVWEWCSTKWRDDYTTAADDSLGGDAARVFRGGAFYLPAMFVRCASRRRFDPGSGDNGIGFRVAVSL